MLSCIRTCFNCCYSLYSGDIEIDMLMNGGTDEHKRGIVMEVEARDFLALPLLTAEEIDQVPEVSYSTIK